MVYVFYGINDFLIEKEVLKLRKGVDSINFVKYDLENTNLTDIIMDADLENLFGDKKVILVENSYIFTGTTNKKLLEQDTKCLESYMQNPNPNTTLIFTIIKDKLDERKKIFKLAREKGYLHEYNNVSDVASFVINNFKPYNIDKKLADLFVSRVGDNLSILNNEIEKIKLYKDTDLNITQNDITELTSKNIDTDIFNLIDNILSSNKEAAILSYHEMLKLGDEPIMILIMLANQFRLTYQVKKLYRMGYSEKNISSMLKVHWYPVRKTIGRMNNYDEGKLLNLLYQLSELDINIKNGKIDKTMGLEMFILQV